MRYLIDTNIVVFMIGDPDMLDENVKALLSELDAILYTSAESAKELVLASGIKDYLPNVGNLLMTCCAQLRTSTISTSARSTASIYTPTQDFASTLNTQQDHKDPSDHVIISHAITEHLPLISSDTRFGYYRPQGLDFIHNQR